MHILDIYVLVIAVLLVGLHAYYFLRLRHILRNRLLKAFLLLLLMAGYGICVTYVLYEHGVPYSF